jgi:hypothetical protein
MEGPLDMSTWTTEELAAIDSATELLISTRRPDGTLRTPIPTWHTAIGDALYIRSARGPENGWFRRAVSSGTGQISAGGVTKDVTFELADPAVRDALTAGLHQKYDRFGSAPIAAITGAGGVPWGGGVSGGVAGVVDVGEPSCDGQ